MRKSPVQVGTKWGMFRVVRFLERNVDGQTRWECRCDCGEKVAVWGYALVKKTKPKTHCGCENKPSPTKTSPSQYNRKRIKVTVEFVLEGPEEDGPTEKRLRKENAERFMKDEIFHSRWSCRRKRVMVRFEG